jgi:hypothetical protein
VSAWLLLIVGTALGVLSLIADLIGVGGYQGFGWKQAVGLAVALVAVGLAAALIVKRERPGES